MAEFIQVLTTTDSRDEADALGRGAVEARLAACVQVFTVASMFWWEGEVERADEYLLAFKTKRELFGDLAGYLEEHHSYDVPEITAVPILDGSDAYLGWIAAETR